MWGRGLVRAGHFQKLLCGGERFVRSGDFQKLLCGGERFVRSGDFQKLICGGRERFNKSWGLEVFSKNFSVIGGEGPLIISVCPETFVLRGLEKLLEILEKKNLEKKSKCLSKPGPEDVLKKLWEEERASLMNQNRETH